MNTKLVPLITVLLCTAILISCDGLLKSEEELKIRLNNVSEFNMDSVLVIFPEDEINYGNLLAGKSSEYRMVNKAYRYAYIQVKINGGLCVLQPIDYMGESLLKPGNYTYILNAFDAGTDEGSESPRLNLSLELQKD